MLFSEDTIEKFTSITGFDVVSFMSDFAIFIGEDRSNIIDYYSGNIKAPDAKSFDFLNQLLIESEQVLNLVSLNRDSFENFAFWNLLEQLEKIHVSLLTVSNASKFLRSNITKNNFNPNPEIDIVLKQNQTLEQFSRNTLQSSDFDNDWIDVALRNDLNEEKYTPAGGVMLKASFKNGSSFFINSVIDNITGLKIYGLDIQEKIEFLDNDLVVLGYQNTIVQAVKILANLRQGANPEFPNEGIQSRLIAGSNVGAISYPSLFRQMFNTFSTDDTLKGFKITKIDQREDALFINFDIETRLSELIGIQTSI